MLKEMEALQAQLAQAEDKVINGTLLDTTIALSLHKNDGKGSPG